MKIEKKNLSESVYSRLKNIIRDFFLPILPENGDQIVGINS